MPNLRTFLARGVSQTIRYGLSLPWHRYVTRLDILRSPPVECPEDGAVEVHSMVCRRDWLNCVWALKSFRAVAGQPFRLIVVDDGSLPPEAVDCFRRHFPGVQMPSVAHVARLVEERLEPIAPTVARLWKSGKWFILRKTVDSWLCARRRFLLKIDPDVLFFRRPAELLDPEKTLAGRYGAFNVHRHGPHRLGMYCVDPDELCARFGIDLLPTFNEGLGMVDTSKTDWALVERIFSSLKIFEDQLFLGAQTIEGILTIAHGFMPLPVERYNAEWDDTPVDQQTVARHYFSKTRDRLYAEGIPRLLAEPLTRKFVA